MDCTCVYVYLHKLGYLSYRRAVFQVVRETEEHTTDPECGFLCFNSRICTKAKWNTWLQCCKDKSHLKIDIYNSRKCWLKLTQQWQSLNSHFYLVKVIEGFEFFFSFVLCCYWYSSGSVSATRLRLWLLHSNRKILQINERCYWNLHPWCKWI